MLKVFLGIFLSAVAVSAISIGGVFAHGEEGSGMMQSGTMGEMMGLMHGRLDSNQATPCSDFTADQLMEEGETMMDVMMGHEDHERVEEAMEQDMHDHDAMHTMMGMVGTGCVGEEVASRIAPRYGFMSGEVESASGVSGLTSRDLSVMGGAFIVGLVVGVLGLRMFKKNTPAA